ncbi:MAG: hypothetical protein K2Y23_06555 [Cyanobacteria bacterium]|nr:hypothetical protein [Cyanobacteriota bacterium]
MPTTKHRLAGVFFLLALQPALGADVLIKETLITAMAGGERRAARTIAIKGERMRIEVAQAGQTTVTLFDLPARATITLDAAKRRATVTPMAVRAAELERKVPRARVTSAIVPREGVREVGGVPCQDFTFSVRVPATSDGDQIVALSGTACVAAVPGTDDYAAFATAAAASDLVIGYASSNKFALAVTRGRTELHRALAAVRGIPLQIDMISKAEGAGLFNRMLNKIVAGTSVSTVTSVTTTPLEDASFAVPNGWKRQQK